MDAIEGLAPVGPDYAHRPVSEAFNWDSTAPAMPPGEWYLVAFRSVRRPEADEGVLTRYDDLAHTEAAALDGFVHYVRGPRSLDGSCLSFCMWTGRIEARSAAGEPAHARAAAIVGEMYSTYRLEFLRLTKAGADAPLVFEPWDRPGADDRPGAHDRPGTDEPIAA